MESTQSHHGAARVHLLGNIANAVGGNHWSLLPQRRTACHCCGTFSRYQSGLSDSADPNKLNMLALLTKRNLTKFQWTLKGTCSKPVQWSNVAFKTSFATSRPLNQSRRQAWLLKVGPDTLPRSGESEEVEGPQAEQEENLEEWWQGSHSDVDRTPPLQSENSQASGSNAFQNWSNNPADSVQWQATYESDGYSSDEEDFDADDVSTLPVAALTVLGEGSQGPAEGEGLAEGLGEGLGQGLGESLEDSAPGRRMVDRVWDLIERLQGNEEETVKLADVKGIFDFSIDKFQRLAIQAFLDGRSVVCCAPTGSGKTLIAEAAAAAVLARGKRILYTTPLKALSNQKLRDFREKFGEENVGLVTGDASVNREAPILVMTTEILRNMLYSSVGAPEGFANKLTNVEAVVLDEVHYLSDISRGTVWEETIIYCPPEVRLVCLSATVANSEELADWIAQVHGPTELVTSTRRPVPLAWHFSTRNRLAPLLNETGTAINPRLVPSRNMRLGEGGWDADPDFPEPRGHRKALRGGNGSVSFRGRGRGRGRVDDEEDEKDMRRRQIPMLKDTLAQLYERDMLPAIWFIFSRKGCDQAVAKLKEAALLTPQEEEQVRLAVDEFRTKYPDAVREHAVGPLYRGLAAHHAGCLPLWKSFVEELFQRGLVKAVFATETLAAGINMPARTTVLSSLSKRGDNGISMLTSNAMLQMAGRAGRRGIDTKGHVVIVQTPFEDAEACTQLLFAGSDPLVSQFKATYGMALNLLQGASVPVDDVADDVADDVIEDVRERRYARAGRTLEEARELVERSFGNYVGSEVMVVANRQLSKLEEDLQRLEDQKAAYAAFDGEPTLENRLPSVDVADWEALIWWKERLKGEKRKKRALQAQLNEARAAHVLPSLKRPWIRPPIAVIEWTEGSAGQRTVTALVIDSVPRPYFLDDREDDVADDVDEDYDDVTEGPAAGAAERESERIRGEAGLEPERGNGFGENREGLSGVRDAFGEVKVDEDDGRGEEDSSDDEYDGSYSKTGPHHVFDRAVTEGYGDGSSAMDRLKSSQLASTSAPELLTWQASKADSYYLCLGADNSWYVVSNRAITSVHPGPKGEAPLESGEDPRGVLKARLKAAGSQNWVNLGGSKVDVWATEGAIETWTWTVQLPPPDALRPDWTDSPTVAAAWERLEAQKRVTAKVRKAVSATPAFKELRLVKTAAAKLTAQIERLEHKATRLRRRIASIEPSGWKEFVRVVQVLSEATAIEQPYADLVAENQTARLTPLGELAAAVRGSNELFLAMVFSDSEIGNLTTEQIAGVAAAVGATEDRKRANSEGLYQSPSKDVLLWMDRVESTRSYLSDLQTASGVQISTDIDLAVAGLAEAWASGVSWKELLEDVRVDEGDIARLLRRTIDLLAQVPFWPHVSKQVKKSAQSAAKIMDRPPISELVG